MKMLTCLRGTGFRKAVALAAGALILSSTQPVAAAGTPGPGRPGATAPVPGEFRALSYLKTDSQHLMVHLENPRQEQVTVLVLNAYQEVVYRHSFGQPPTFVGKFSLSGLPNGQYTFVVKGARHTHTRNILVETQSARVLRVL